MNGGSHTGGKPEADSDAVALALEMHGSGKFKMQEIVAATGLSRATIYRRIADVRDGENAAGVEYEENATREPPASGPMPSARSAKGWPHGAGPS